MTTIYDRRYTKRQAYAEMMIGKAITENPSKAMTKVTIHDLRPGDIFTMWGYGLLLVSRRPTFNVTSSHVQASFEAHHFDGEKPDPVRLTITTDASYEVNVLR